MKILIVSIFFPPLNSIASLRPYHWAKNWSEAGHEVTVLTLDCCPGGTNYVELPDTKALVIRVPNQPPFARLKRRFRRPSSAQVDSPCGHARRGFFARFMSWMRNDRGLFSSCRAPDLMQFWVNPALAALDGQGPWDFVVSTTGPFPVQFVARKLKISGRARLWVSDYRDFWSNNDAFPGLFPFTWWEFLMERLLLRDVDMVTTVSNEYAQRFSEHFGVSTVRCIPNGYDADDSARMSVEPVFPSDGKLRIVYTGMFYGLHRDPRPLFRAIRILSESLEERSLLDSFELVFAGPNQAPLADLVTEYAIGNWVRLCGQVSRDQAMRMQRDADLLLFLPWSDAGSDGVLTGKIFEYLNSGTPILAVGARHIEASQRLIIELNAGTVLHRDDDVIIYLRSVLHKGVPQFSVDRGGLAKYDRKISSLQLLRAMEELAIL